MYMLRLALALTPCAKAFSQWRRRLQETELGQEI